MSAGSNWNLDRVREEVAKIKLDLTANPPPRDQYISAFKAKLQTMPTEWRGFALEVFNMGLDFGVDMKETNRIIHATQQRNSMIMLGIGLALLLLSIVLAFFVPNPTPQQNLLISLLAGLGAAAFVVMLPGFLELKGAMAPNPVFHSLAFKGGGGAAVFVLVFILMHWFLKH